MRKTALLCAALGLCSLGVAPASAAPVPTATVMTGEVSYPSLIPSPLTDPLWGHCRMVVVAEATLTGGQDTFTGVAVGVAVDTNLRPLDVRCFVRVDGAGSDGAATPSGTTLPGVDTTAGQVTFTATPGQQVELCIVFGLGIGIGPVCEPTTTTQVPPQAVVDLLDSLLTTVDDVLFPILHIADSTICPILASLSPGVPGVLDISPWGDVWVLGTEVHDCPPYDF